MKIDLDGVKALLALIAFGAGLLFLPSVRQLRHRSGTYFEQIASGEISDEITGIGAVFFVLFVYCIVWALLPTILRK